MRVCSLSNKDYTSKLLIQKKDNRCNICAESILKNTRIGSVLNIKVCYHDDRYSIEVHIPSLFEDNTASWVRIGNVVDKYVTESMLTTKEEDMASEKPIAKARPRQKPTVTLTSVSIPVLERKWIDIETQRSHDQKRYEVSKAIIRLLRLVNQSFEEATEPHRASKQRSRMESPLAFCRSTPGKLAWSRSLKQPLPPTSARLMTRTKRRQSCTCRRRPRQQTRRGSKPLEVCKDPA